MVPIIQRCLFFLLQTVKYSAQVTKSGNSVTIRFDYWVLSVNNFPSFDLLGTYDSVTGSIAFSVYVTGTTTVSATSTFTRGIHEYIRTSHFKDNN